MILPEGIKRALKDTIIKMLTSKKIEKFKMLRIIYCKRSEEVFEQRFIYMNFWILH